MPKRSDIQRAVDHVDAQIEKLMAVRAALEATREAITRVKPKTRTKKPTTLTEVVRPTGTAV